MKHVLADFRNRVINDDVMNVLAHLPDDSVDMVYGDPDYNVGISYDSKSYTSSWDSYIDWYGKLAEESFRVLSPDGNLFLINYPKQNAHLRVKFLDNIAFTIHEYVWIYNTNVGHSMRRFTTAHRSILHVTKSARNKWYKDQVAQPYKNPDDPRIRKRIAEGHKGRMPYSWLYYNLVKNVSRNKTNHPCQIPEGLSGLLINASTTPGDLVFILFGGSGSEVVQARKLGRDFITSELLDSYCEIIESRLKNNGEIPYQYRHPAYKKNGILIS